MRKIISAAVLSGIVAVLLLFHIYVEAEFPGPAQVLWNQDRIFVFLQKNEQGWRLTPIQFLLNALRSAAGGYARFSDSRSDVSVFEISQSEFRSHVVLGFDVLSGVFPYHGALYVMYYENGKPEMPRNYRWNGETFVPIAADEATRIRSDFQYVSEVVRREGWNSQPIPQNANSGTIIPIITADRRYSLEVQSPGGGKTVVILRDPSGARTLAEYDSKIRRYLSETQYQAIFGVK